MDFAIVCIGAIVALGIVAAIASRLQGGDDEIVAAAGHDCASCSSADDGSCKLHCLMEERKGAAAEGAEKVKKAKETQNWK